jgi:hypothetical protein
MLVRREQLQSSTHVLLGLTLILKVSIVPSAKQATFALERILPSKFLVLMAPSLSLARLIVRIVLVDTNAPQPEVSL